MLFECRCFRGIEIFRRFIPHDTPTEADHPAPPVADGKHDAVAETVIETTGLLADSQPGSQQAVGWQGVGQAAPAWWGIANFEVLDYVVA